MKKLEKPGKKYVWHVVYEDKTYSVHNTREEAYFVAKHSIKSVKHIVRREVTE